MVSRLRGGSRLVDVAEDEAERGGLNVPFSDVAKLDDDSFGKEEEKVNMENLPTGILIARERKLNVVEAHLRMTPEELEHLALAESALAGPGTDPETVTASRVIKPDSGLEDGEPNLSEPSQESVVNSLGNSFTAVLAATRARPKSAAALLRRHQSTQKQVKVAARKRIAKKSDVGKEKGVELKDRFQKVSPDSATPETFFKLLTFISETTVDV